MRNKIDTDTDTIHNNSTEMNLGPITPYADQGHVQINYCDFVENSNKSLIKNFTLGLKI